MQTKRTKPVARKKPRTVNWSLQKKRQRASFQLGFWVNEAHYWQRFIQHVHDKLLLRGFGREQDPRGIDERRAKHDYVGRRLLRMRGFFENRQGMAEENIKRFGTRLEELGVSKQQLPFLRARPKRITPLQNWEWDPFEDYLFLQTSLLRTAKRFDYTRMKPRSAK